MATDEQIQATLKQHFESWNAGEREDWLSLWQDDVQIEDPVGGPEKSGRSAVEGTWENAFKDGAVWTMHPLFVQICGGQAAIHAKNVGKVGGEEIVIESIERSEIGDADKPLSQLES